MQAEDCLHASQKRQLPGARGAAPPRRLRVKKA
jgi:hypothetical protein